MISSLVYIYMYYIYIYCNYYDCTNNNGIVLLSKIIQILEENQFEWELMEDWRNIRKYRGVKLVTPVT